MTALVDDPVEAVGAAADEANARLARLARALERSNFGRHYYGHKGQKASAKWRARGRAKIARASRQRNRR